MDNSKTKKITCSLIVVLLIIFSIIATVSYTSRYINEMRHQFFCSNIRKGMSKEDIKSVIASYGKYTWQDDNIVQLSNVYFQDFIHMNVLGSPVVLKFDNDKLVSIGSRYKLGDELKINCNK